jgi:hypothetical protein
MTVTWEITDIVRDVRWDSSSANPTAPEAISGLRLSPVQARESAIGSERWRVDRLVLLARVSTVHVRADALHYADKDLVRPTAARRIAGSGKGAVPPSLAGCAEVPFPRS